MRNFDGGLLFKVLVILAILTARWSSSKRKKQMSTTKSAALDHSRTLAEFWDAYRLYIMIILVVVGFFIQSGYLEFLYNFFIKENYPVRIWCGEDVDMEALQQPDPQQQQNRAQQPRPRLEREAQARRVREQEGRGGVDGFLDWNRIWREGVLRLMVGPPPHERVNDRFLVQVGRLVAKTLIDFFCLVGSFVLSIFPMVNLEGLRLQAAAADDGHRHDNGAIPQPAGAAARAREDRHDPAPGRVDPPREPAAPLDE
jgi:hypothetical protein